MFLCCNRPDDADISLEESILDLNLEQVRRIITDDPAILGEKILYHGEVRLLEATLCQLQRGPALFQVLFEACQDIVTKLIPAPPICHEDVSDILASIQDGSVTSWSETFPPLPLPPVFGPWDPLKFETPLRRRGRGDYAHFATLLEVALCYLPWTVQTVVLRCSVAHAIKNGGCALSLALPFLACCCFGSPRILSTSLTLKHCSVRPERHLAMKDAALASTTTALPCFNPLLLAVVSGKTALHKVKMLLRFRVVESSSIASIVFSHACIYSSLDRALYLAACVDNTALLQMLLHAGATPGRSLMPLWPKQDEQYSQLEARLAVHAPTALYASVTFGNFAACRMLCEAGASVHVIDSAGVPLLNRAIAGTEQAIETPVPFDSLKDPRQLWKRDSPRPRWAAPASPPSFESLSPRGARDIFSLLLAYKTQPKALCCEVELNSTTSTASVGPWTDLDVRAAHDGEPDELPRLKQEFREWVSSEKKSFCF
ncbi:MAG: uncharacterized protein KVP18_000414 [Porospora cf. gigantea A]|uniref:uncharacterized protein n=1 Tax=Porospora cf. gigantea A TaxID=2853593 RepID=UPI003559750C|nr:MAG: hypothetical protein KVP18_000414 [Porospora cf. gigantea A]